MLLQAGKMGRDKQVLESLRAFAATRSPRLRFVLAGHLYDEVQPEADALLAADSRTSFLGWCAPEEMLDLLCAADVYVQPGTQSATMQMSLCARCPVMLADVPSHRPFVEDNGWLLGAPGDLSAAMAEVDAYPERLPRMAERSLAVARRLLDYRNLARRVAA
jgi:1,2-diacylglycerol 3-alpha-glucosyltransferase